LAALRLAVITGLFWLIVDLFRRLLQIVERLMYSVDEWLRFRSGESRLSLIAKAGLGSCGSSWPTCCDSPSTCSSNRDQPNQAHSVVTVGTNCC